MAGRRRISHTTHPLNNPEEIVNDHAVSAAAERAAGQPDSADAHAALGAALFNARRNDEAVAAFDIALELRPDDPKFLVGRGKAHYENNEHEAAAEDLRTAATLLPGDPEPLTFLAAALHDQDEDELAFPHLDAALTINPNYAPAHFFRGRIAEKFGDEDGAFADFNRAIELDPLYPFPYSFRAGIWGGWGESERAVEDRARYLHLFPTADAYHSQAHAWQRLDEDDKASECFAHAIRLEPNGTRHYSCRAGHWRSLGEYDQADADYDAIDLITQAEEESDAMTPAIEQKMKVFNQIQEHFGAIPLDEVQVVSRKFPVRVGADLQLALDKLAAGGIEVKQLWTLHVCGQAPHEFTQLYTRDRRNPPTAVPPEYVEIDVGEDEPVRALKFGVWLLAADGVNFLLMLDTQRHGEIYFQVAAPAGDAGKAVATKLFTHLETCLKTASCYRGKVLSLEYQDSYNGQQYGILVHKTRPVKRDEVILPEATLQLLERNVIRFVKQRKKLGEMGMSTKKGLLFYGPPGTGKTHTIHYLTRCVDGQTTLLITAEQVGMLGEYMTLARLFQPCMVVIEDVDLIARDRTQMHTPSEEVLLNKLLNEMDGLKPNTDILFVLTTNRPEKLEAALASRPGRIDQAIEFPLPDEAGRAKLVRLYARGMVVPDEVATAVVKKTDQVSASFIKELMRRATQFYLEREGTGPLAMADVESALEEMLFSGGSLNRLLLGAAAPNEATGADIPF